LAPRTSRPTNYVTRQAPSGCSRWNCSSPVLIPVCGWAGGFCCADADAAIRAPNAAATDRLKVDMGCFLQGHELVSDAGNYVRGVEVP
jgi:hypothetical protein